MATDGAPVALAADGTVGGPGGPVGGRVAVLLDHGASTVAAILGTLAAGAAYVPADPSYPRARLAHLLRDSGVHTVLVDARTRGLAAELAAEAASGHPARGTSGRALRVVDVTGLPAASLPVPDTDLDAEAYVLYTSGSTGLPKGVVQSHRNVLFAAGNHIDNSRIDPADRVSVLSSFSFDMAITDLFSALLSGAAAVPVDIRRHGLLHLVEALRDRKVSVYHSTPTVYRHLVAALEGGRLPAIRVVLLGGEAVHAADAVAYWRHFAPDGVFVNGYGATEISFIAQDHLTAPPVGGVVPVGHPLPGIEVTLCTPEGAPAALVGEIVVRSRHLALGYVGRPFPAVGAARTYRTGDLARRLPDGRLVHLGRVDRQVKIRGYRVELGEVEAVLAELPGVRQAVAVARDRPTAGAVPAERELLCYAAGAAGLDPDELLAGLSQRLPHYLVPRAVVVLDELPTTPTGKVDVAALPAAPTATEPAELPDDPLVRTVAAAWCAELGVPSVDIGRSFFDLGGHSLALAGVQRRLERDLGVRLPLLDLFEYPTVTALAARCAEVRGDAAVVSTVDDVRIPAARAGTADATVPSTVDDTGAGAEAPAVAAETARRGGVATSVGADRLAARVARRAARRSAR
jgi:amino acid adenylation domain-containing protein